MTKRKKILVINLTRMGDILQSVPLLKALKAREPEAVIYYLAVSGYAPICQFISPIDRLIPFDFNSAVAISKEAVRFLPQRIRELLNFVQTLKSENFDEVYNLSHSRISALICHLLGVENTKGLTLDREGFRQIRHPWARYFFTANLNRNYNRFNLVDINLGLSLNIGEFSPDFKDHFYPFGQHNLNINLPALVNEGAEKILLGWEGIKSPVLIGLQPGASLPCKRWPAESFRKLGELLIKEMNAGIIVFGTKDEADLAKEVCVTLGAKALNLAGKTDIGMLAAVVGKTNLLVTNDTGTQHIAVAMNVPVLSLCFGSALSHETAPYGENHVVLESAISCYPCSFHVECNHYRCQETVKPQSVMQVVDWMLSEMKDGKKLIANSSDYAENRIWKTDFYQDGFLILRPVIPKTLKISDYINYCAKAIWTYILTRQKIDLDSVANLDESAVLKHLTDHTAPDFEKFQKGMREPLRIITRLMNLAKAGRECCEILSGTSADNPEDKQLIVLIAEEMQKIDQEITLLGLTFPAVNHLVLDFNFLKQNLQGNEIKDLAMKSERLYNRISGIANQFYSALNRWETIFNAAGWSSRRESNREFPELCYRQSLPPAELSEAV